MAGLTLGPLVGGALLEYFWWGSVFLVSVPGIVLLLVFGPSLRADQKAPRPGKLDPVSVVLSLATILPFVYGLKELARYGFEWFPAVAPVFGLAAGVAFVQRQRHLTHPLLDLRMFGNRTFSSALTLMFLASVVGTGTALLVNLYPAERHRPHPAGRRHAPAGAQRGDDHRQPVHPTTGEPHPSGVRDRWRAVRRGPRVHDLHVGRLDIRPRDDLRRDVCRHARHRTAGRALQPPRDGGAVPPDKAGSGASIVQTTNEFGLGLGVATLGTLGTAVYRINVERALGAVPADAATAARESIDRAVAAAAQLPAGQGADLLAAARDAFTSGLHKVGIVSAIFYTGSAVLAVWAFKHVRNSHGGDDTTKDDTMTKDQAADPEPEATPA
ncbi:MFS transporter [Tenggerimyces flavus]|uniref:MFS transporter n=1 Tax=Tenggerimyces flavus TaxID=1708749 RepID=A0ABV7Y3R0_9ACTN|nr:hypothetical protein [Tenggerimyces flavus]MBM7790107.1 DHA2 family multidrug resistance protein-like MFS transporter [Tenggerimyces flavus]